MDKMIPKTIQAYEYVKSGLKTGKWLFGDELLVMDISKEMNFSRRPVIDALKKLEMERFVEIIRKRAAASSIVPKSRWLTIFKSECVWKDLQPDWPHEEEKIQRFKS